jgi:hypothetical protein
MKEKVAARTFYLLLEPKTFLHPERYRVVTNGKFDNGAFWDLGVGNESISVKTERGREMSAVLGMRFVGEKNLSGEKLGTLLYVRPEAVGQVENFLKDRGYDRIRPPRNIDRPRF